VTVFLANTVLAVSADTTATTDWPQWRGPTRDGVAGPGPKLADAWPEGGPKLLWKSDPIPSGKFGQEGGSGSPVVADGKVFLFINSHRENGKVVLTTKDFMDWGWAEGVPEDLFKKVHEELKNICNKRLTGAARDARIKEYMATLDPKQAEKFKDFIQGWLHRENAGYDDFFDDLNKGAMEVRDKEFDTLDALLAHVPGGHYGAIHQMVRDKLFGKSLRSCDTVLCLDAATGMTAWKKEFPGAPSSQAINWGASSTPAIADGKCYVAGSAGFYCLSVKDGSVVWQAKTKLSNSSPLVTNGVVYVAVPAPTAYDARTGHVLWCLTNMTMECTSFVKWPHGGTNYLIGAWQGGASCLAPASGKELWRLGTGWMVSTPVILGDDLILRGFRYKIMPEKAQQIWYKASDSDAGSQLVYEGCVYHTGGHCYSPQLRCLDLATGETKWERGGPEVRAPSPVLADGKIFAPLDGAEGWSSTSVIMVKPLSEKYIELGKFNPKAASCASPAIVGGRLYLRLVNCVACYDIAEHRPYMDNVKMAKNELVLNFKQAEGGLSANGVIEGVTLTDATGKTGPAKAHAKGSSLLVEVKDAVFPVTIACTNSGNLSASAGPVAPFEWHSPRLMFERCETNVLVMKFDRYADRDDWKTAQSYAVAGAKVTGVELDPFRKELRLATDKTWKSGEKTTVRYPALFQAQEEKERSVELSFTVTPGRPVDEQSIREVLVGEIREKVDSKTVFEQDDLDKNSKPVAGAKWKVARTEPLINLRDLLGNHDRPLGHACVYLHSETACKVQLWVNVQGGAMQIFVNGKPVYTETKSWQNTKIKDVELKKGWNTVLLGTTQDNWWAFSLFIRNEQGDAAPEGLRYTAEAPKE
jgi:outer membrane protein assembly factor BamB